MAIPPLFLITKCKYSKNWLRMTLSQSFGYTFIYFTYYEHIHYMLQKNKKGL